MRKLRLPLILLLGLGTGGGAAYATHLLMPAAAKPVAAAAEVPASFVDVGKVVAPLVTPDGRLAGYESFAVQLDVAEDKGEWVTARLPLLLHAINMRTFRTPMAAGPDGLLPDLATFRTLVGEAAHEAFGASVVRRVAITQAVPA